MAESLKALRPLKRRLLEQRDHEYTSIDDFEKLVVSGNKTHSTWPKTQPSSQTRRQHLGRMKRKHENITNDAAHPISQSQVPNGGHPQDQPETPAKGKKAKTNGIFPTVRKHEKEITDSTNEKKHNEMCNAKQIPATLPITSTHDSCVTRLCDVCSEAGPSNVRIDSDSSPIPRPSGVFMNETCKQRVQASVSHSNSSSAKVQSAPAKAIKTNPVALTKITRKNSSPVVSESHQLTDESQNTSDKESATTLLKSFQVDRQSKKDTKPEPTARDRKSEQHPSPDSEVTSSSGSESEDELESESESASGSEDYDSQCDQGSDLDPQSTKTTPPSSISASTSNSQNREYQIYGTESSHFIDIPHTIEREITEYMSQLEHETHTKIAHARQLGVKGLRIHGKMRSDIDDAQRLLGEKKKELSKMKSTKPRPSVASCGRTRSQNGAKTQEKWDPENTSRTSKTVSDCSEESEDEDYDSNESDGDSDDE